METREWLGKAAEDLAAVRVIIDSKHFAGDFLTWHERTFRRTHDVE